MIPFPKFDNETYRLIFWGVVFLGALGLMLVLVLTDALDVDAVWGYVFGTGTAGGAARAATKSDRTPL